MSDVHAALMAANVQELRLRAVMVLDWRDGPIEGVAAVGAGDSYWQFRLFAEHADSDDLDDRIFLFSPISDVVSAVVRGVDRGPDDRPLVWPFGEEVDSAEIEAAINAVSASDPPPLLLIRSADFKSVSGAWRLVPTSS